MVEAIKKYRHIFTRLCVHFDLMLGPGSLYFPENTNPHLLQSKSYFAHHLMSS